MARLFFLFLICILCIAIISAAPKKPKEKDPKDCEVCIKNLEAIDQLVPKDKKSDQDAIEAAVTKHCTKSGFGSTWKPSELLTDPKDEKMCYYFQPIKKSLSHPFSTGMPKDKVCQRLKKDNPEICDVRYAIKVPKSDASGAPMDYNKLKVKELKTILDQRGVKCSGCTEKPEFVKKCTETEHLEM
jgi:hypothetical protein